ncbi:hypothetical protein MIMGU_mgv1a019324mg, partial [Erythranthe guttata]
MVDPVEYFEQNDIPRSWSFRISSLVSENRSEEAIGLFKAMLVSGDRPNFVTVLSVVKAVGSLGSKDLACGIHGYSIKTGLIDSQVAIVTALVGVYSCWDMRSAWKLFNRARNKDVVMCSAMVFACVSNGEHSEALKLFKEMLLCGILPNHVTLSSILPVCAGLVKPNLGREIHGYSIKRSLYCHTILWNSILDMYSKCRDLEAALRVFKHMQNKDMVSWRIMIRGCVVNNKPKKALEIFRELRAYSAEKLDEYIMQERPNEFTFVSLLLACTSLDAIELGESVHSQITKNGYSTNTFLTSALIDMYCKFGRTRQGKSVFDENTTNDFVCWSSMINGYAINGCGNEVLECFSDMLSHGIEPNDVIFVSVLSACSHCGLEYEGWRWFLAMEAKYCIKPKLAHYACMVDMLSRQGNVEEALEFVNKMPMEPDKRIWGAILAGCRNSYGCNEVLEFVAKKLISLDPENTNYYVVLSNMYAEQGRWEEAEKLRNMIDTKSLKKV